MKTTARLTAALALGCGLLIGLGCDRGDTHDDAHGPDAHGGDPHAGEDGHGGEVVRLSAEQLERAGVRVEPLSGGVITTYLTLPAEVGLNEDAVVHVTPRVPGIVTEVRALLGDEVAAGDVLAVMESPELGEAKIALMQALQARALADAELVRQRTISENTSRLLAILASDPSPEALRAQAASLRMGESKGRLLSAHARLRAAESNHARERELRERGLSTQADLLAAQEAYHSAQADYLAVLEEADFAYAVRLEQAERGARVAASAVDIAQRRLMLLGLSEAQVRGVEDRPGENAARYELVAPMGGRIVSKHLVVGERVSMERAVYTIADLGTVWLNIAVHGAYGESVRAGQQVVVRAGDRTGAGVVDYVSAMVSEPARTVTARVRLENAARAWRPGEFVTARVAIGRVESERVVPVEAVQFYEGREVVFVLCEDVFEPVAVRTGARDDRLVALTGDELAVGTPVVTVNSFLMKAELGKGAGGHDH